jgi:signal transduction histidine kinase
LNILSNSIKFTEPRGQIQIDFAMHKSGDIVLSIRDTGIGIPPEQLGNVFQPFERVEDHLTREHEGSGLGLPIAKALMELHGGELVLSSQLGAGTTARLRLPSDRVHGIQASSAAQNTDRHPPAAQRQTCSLPSS